MKKLTPSQPEATIHLELSPDELVLLDAVLEQQWYQIQEHEYDSWDTTPEKYAALSDKISELCKNLPEDTTLADDEGCSLLMIAR